MGQGAASAFRALQAHLMFSGGQSSGHELKGLHRHLTEEQPLQKNTPLLLFPTPALLASLLTVPSCLPLAGENDNSLPGPVQASCLWP